MNHSARMLTPGMVCISPPFVSDSMRETMIGSASPLTTDIDLFHIKHLIREHRGMYAANKDRTIQVKWNVKGELPPEPGQAWGYMPLYRLRLDGTLAVPPPGNPNLRVQPDRPRLKP